MTVTLALALPASWARAQAPAETSLAAPTADPFNLDREHDPVLQLGRKTVSPEAFRAAIAAAVARSPALRESIATRQEAEAARAEARSRRLPVVDVSINHFETLSRSFIDPANLLEQLQPTHRTDASLQVRQSVVDFGGAASRIEAANARTDAAAAQVEDVGGQLALRAVAAWYNVFAYRALVRLAGDFESSLGEARGKIEERITTGVASTADLAQIDGYVAATRVQKADFQRALASAEAQYAEISGAPAPAGLDRAPAPDLSPVTQASLEQDAGQLPAVRVAGKLSAAAKSDAKAAVADTLPSLTAGIDGGRYGLLEGSNDYNVRGSVTLSYRLFGGGGRQRADQADARARSAEAHYDTVLEESVRDARMAWADLAALQQARDAMETNYVAARQSRDVLAERFRVSRASVFELLSAENNYFSVAARYIQTVTELDISRYTLLARTGRLLDSLGIQTGRS